MFKVHEAGKASIYADEIALYGFDGEDMAAIWFARETLPSHYDTVTIDVSAEDLKLLQEILSRYTQQAVDKFNAKHALAGHAL